MKTKKMILPMVCCIPLLGSCTSVQTASNEILGVNPVYSINQTTDSPDALYQLGRYYQGQQRYEQAAAAYLRALAANQEFVEARNGLGVVYATQGYYEHAITAFRTAISQAPDAAHLYNNLGHALYLQGDYPGAVAALEQAATLDPANPRTLSNLSLAQAKAGNPAATPPISVATVAAPTSQHIAPQSSPQPTPVAPAAMAQTQLPVPPNSATVKPSPQPRRLPQKVAWKRYSLRQTSTNYANASHQCKLQPHRPIRNLW